MSDGSARRRHVLGALGTEIFGKTNLFLRVLALLRDRSCCTSFCFGIENAWMFLCRLHLLGDEVRRSPVSVLEGAAENFTKDGIVRLFHPLQRDAAVSTEGQVSGAPGACKETRTIDKKSDS